MADYAASVQGVMMRVTRLEDLGCIAADLTGVGKTSYITNAFMSVSFTVEFEDGDEVAEKNAAGEVCVSYKAPDTLKRVTMEIAICDPDPELTQLLAGGTVLYDPADAFTVTNKALTSNVATLTIGTHTVESGDSITVTGVDATFNGTYVVSGVGATTVSYAKTAADVTGVASSGSVAGPSGDVVGYAAPLVGVDPTPLGVGVEVWSYAIVDGARKGFWWWLFPNVRLRASGDRVIENGMLANTFEGYGVGNDSWNTGPDGAWAWITDRPYQYVRTLTYPTLSGGGKRGWFFPVVDSCP